MAKLAVEWIDGGRMPRCAPDSAYPAGKDIDASGGAAVTCSTPLPYPARRCGVYVVTCYKCYMRVALTTAGRPDDPRSIKIRCNAKVPDHG